jgi:hypothetical protein
VLSIQSFAQADVAVGVVRIAADGVTINRGSLFVAATDEVKLTERR